MTTYSQPHTHFHCVHNEPEDRLADIEAMCKQSNIRLTPLRKEVLLLILENDEPMGAYDILAKLKNRPKPAAPPTVYRSLNFLLEHGFIHRLASVNAYIPCCHPRESHEAAFLICTSCNKVLEFSKRPIFSELADIIQETAFQPHSTTIEINGICHQCQS